MVSETRVANFQKSMGRVGFYLFVRKLAVREKD